MKKWMIGLMCGLVGVTAAMGALTSPATLPLEYAGESGWKTADLDALTGWDATGLGTVYAAPNASCKFDSAGDNIIIYFDSAPGEIVYSARRSDSTPLAGTYEAKLQESVDNSTWRDVRTFDGSEFTGTLVTFTNTLSSSSRYVKFVYVTKPTGQNFGIGYVKITTGGPAVLGVSFDKTSGFTVEEGSSATITATAVNGTPGYTYTWTTDLGASYRTISEGVLTILDSAPIGTYSASVVATDSASAKVTNSINFSVVAPVTKYGITVTAPVNGTVTTTPATEAAAGATVTVNATADSGYAVGTIVVNGGAVAVSGTTFTMPAEAVTVAVTFQEASTSGALIISQYYEGTSYNKWIEIYNSGSAAVDLAAGEYYLGSWNNASREDWKTGVAPTKSVALTGTIAAGGTYLVNDSRATLPAYATANLSYTLDYNEDDSVVLYTGATYAFANVVDAFGLLSATAKDKSFVRKDTITAGVNTDFNAADWDTFTLAEVEAAAESTNERIGYHSTGAAVLSVGFDKTTGFKVDEGTSATITATAVNGTPGYTYTWTTDLGASYRTISEGVLTILDSAPIGTYSASVVATDSASATASNSLTFSVAAPATKYGITVTAPVNGTVTTTPATEAEAGATVTINATPNGGYAVDTILVNAGAVAVTGNTFTMPAQAVTVTVTFMVSAVPDVLIDFEDYTGSYAWNEYVAGGVTWTMTNVYVGNTVDDAKNGTKSGRFENNRGGVGNPATMTSTAFAEPITKINFWYANFGVNDGGAFKVQVSDDGATWADVGEAEYNPDSKTLVQGTIEPIPAGMTYVQFITTAGAAQRVNIDDIGLYFGVPTFSVSVDKSNGFTVNQGSADSITATAANGTPEYTYSWGTTLPSGFSSAGAVFSIQAGAPVGNWSATVTATDATMATAQKTVTFSVVGLPPGQPAVVISGNLTGTVGVPLMLNITVTNEIATDWGFVLTDPDSVADYTTDYSGFPPVWALTPAKEGTYTLTVTAVTGSGSISNTVNLVISAASTDPEIAAITFVAGTGFTFEVPTGSTLVRVEGADTTVTGQAFTWTTLGSPTDYELVGTTVTIKSGAAAQRLIRVWFN